MKKTFNHLIVLTILSILVSCKSDANQNHMDTIKKNYNSVESIWTAFLNENPQNKTKKTPVSYYFCDNEKDANECIVLVEKGIKRATATSLWWFEKNKEPLPKVGDLYIVTDWYGNAKAIIETTKVEKTSYNEITAEFAAAEGEGDKSLTYWKDVHKAYYTRELKAYNEKFDENMMIVCEYFKTIYLK